MLVDSGLNISLFMVTFCLLSSKAGGNSLKKFDLTWRISPYPSWVNATTKHLLSEYCQEVFDVWRTAIEEFSFTQTSSTAADITVGFYEGEHGDAAAFDGQGGLIAHNILPMANNRRSEIHVDEDDVHMTDLLKPGGTRLFYAMVHDAGHALGLTDAKSRQSIMNGQYVMSSLKIGTWPILHRADVTNIRELYSLSSGPQEPLDGYSGTKERHVTAPGKEDICLSPLKHKMVIQKAIWDCQLRSNSVDRENVDAYTIWRTVFLTLECFTAQFRSCNYTNAELTGAYRDVFCSNVNQRVSRRFDLARGFCNDDRHVKKPTGATVNVYNGSSSVVLRGIDCLSKNRTDYEQELHKCTVQYNGLLGQNQSISTENLLCMTKSPACVLAESVSKCLADTKENLDPVLTSREYCEVANKYLLGCSEKNQINCTAIGDTKVELQSALPWVGLMISGLGFLLVIAAVIILFILITKRQKNNTKKTLQQTDDIPLKDRALPNPPLSNGSDYDHLYDQSTDRYYFSVIDDNTKNPSAYYLSLLDEYSKNMCIDHKETYRKLQTCRRHTVSHSTLNERRTNSDPKPFREQTKKTLTNEGDSDTSTYILELGGENSSLVLKQLTSSLNKCNSLPQTVKL